MKTAVLSPEKEPYRGKDEGAPEEGEEREDTLIINVARVKGSLAWFVKVDGWGGVPAGEEGGERGGIARRWNSIALEEREEFMTCR